MTTVLVETRLITVVNKSANNLEVLTFYNGMLVPVRTCFNLRWRREKTYNVSTQG